MKKINFKSPKSRISEISQQTLDSPYSYKHESNIIEAPISVESNKNVKRLRPQVIETKHNTLKNFSITIENAQNSSIRISNPPLIQKNESKEKSDVTIKQCENPTRKESVNMKEISQENIEECSISTFE